LNRFDEFDEEPIASASLAQVHRATLNGKQLAVKVQHFGLQDTVDIDVRTVDFLVRIVAKVRFFISFCSLQASNPNMAIVFFFFLFVFVK
jgi:predicted unusual protein kinase regulating ubiquinone biosynthesis (AarF/ABC1/UbiB family)